MKNKILKSLGAFLAVVAPTAIMVSCDENRSNGIKNIYKYNLFAPQKSYGDSIDLVINKNKVQRVEIIDNYNYSRSVVVKGNSTNLQLYKKIHIIFNVAAAPITDLTIFLSDFIPPKYNSQVIDEYYTTDENIFNKIVKDISSQFYEDRTCNIHIKLKYKK